MPSKRSARGTPFKVGGLLPQRFHPTPGIF